MSSTLTNSFRRLTLTVIWVLLPTRITYFSAAADRSSSSSRERWRFDPRCSSSQQNAASRHPSSTCRIQTPLTPFKSLSSWDRLRAASRSQNLLSKTFSQTSTPKTTSAAGRMSRTGRGRGRWCDVLEAILSRAFNVYRKMDKQLWYLVSLERLDQTYNH